MSKEQILSMARKFLARVGVSLDLSKLELYYDGPADEEFTVSGTPVFQCPVWYGGLFSDPESFTISVYEMNLGVCISLHRIFERRRMINYDYFIRTAS